jgi:hypothetical protein
MPNDEINVYDLAKELVAYSVVNSPTYVPPEVNEYELSDKQSNYLQGLVAGKRPVEMCETLGMSRVQPYLWKKNHKLFREALELIENMQADDLEASMWQEALSGDVNPIQKFFLLKARKAQYRENAPAQGANTVNIKVSIGEQEFKMVDVTQRENED